MNSTPDYSALIAANAARWRAAQYSPSRGFAMVAQRLCAAKGRYQLVSEQCDVPWHVIAVIHEREASQRWDRQLGQGDPLNSVSVHVPKGRGPFIGPNAWELGARDALVDCPPYASKWKDWSAGGTLTLLELYNGEGYELYHHMASPYLWGGSDQYARGKYIADGKFDPNVVDMQIGCAGMLDAMRKRDPSIRFADEATQAQWPSPDAPKVIPPSPPDVPPVVPAPQPSGLWAMLFAIIAAIFKRKRQWTGS